MNDILLKGPDVLNPIRAVLLRFRGNVHAVLGDIKKMYNSCGWRSVRCICTDFSGETVQMKR